MKNYLFAAIAMLAAVVSARAEEDCRLQLAATLPLTFDGSGRVTVQAAIGETPITLLVDTGAPFSVLREPLAQRLGLKYDVLLNKRVELLGGVKMYRYTAVKGFTLGKLKGDGPVFALMPDNEVDQSMPDGLLGANILSVYDVDFDFAHAKLNLFLPHRCPGRVVYWTQDESAIAKIPMNVQHGLHIEVPVAVEGTPMNAYFDTGAAGSMMDLDDASKFGLTPSSPDMKPHGAAVDGKIAYLHTFKTLSFEGVTVMNATIDLEPYEKTHYRGHDMLLGIEILRQLHLYIAYQERMLYVTAAGAH